MDDPTGQTIDAFVTKSVEQLILDGSLGQEGVDLRSSFEHIHAS